MTASFADVVEALAEHVKANWFIKFGELAKYLEARGISIDGDEALTGANLGQPHVDPATTLLGPVSDEYVQIVEALFRTKPVMLEIGDLAGFATGESRGS